MMESDLDLLRRYVKDRSEEAFASLVHRHVDLVFSAALRQIKSPQLAEEIAQVVFVHLAQSASRLKPDTILTAWLYQVTRRTAMDVIRREARRQLREQIATEMSIMNSPEATWKDIEPLLDEGVSALEETDRTAVLLRYFENKSLREVGERLGISDDAAQKRVSRAVERLREFFSRRGIVIGGGGLVVLVAANAVQAAPAGMAVGLSTLAFSGTSFTATTTITAVKTIAMTTLQKTLVVATVTALAGFGIYQAKQASSARTELRTVQQQQAPLFLENQQLQRERDDATNRLVLLNDEIAHLKAARNANELLKLRGTIGSLRQQMASSETKTNPPSSGFSKMMNDPTMKEYIHQTQLNLIKVRYARLFQELKLTPEQTEKFIQLMGDSFLKQSERLAAAVSGNSGESTSSRDLDSQLNEELRNLIGDAGVDRLNEYQREIPARATIDLLNGQLGSNQLNDDQTARLFSLINAEPFDLTHGISGDFDKGLIGSPDEVQAYLQRIRESNQRVVNQAQGFLTPNQLAALNTVLSNGITARMTQAAALVQKN